MSHFRVPRASASNKEIDRHNARTIGSVLGGVSTSETIQYDEQCKENHQVIQELADAPSDTGQSEASGAEETHLALIYGLYPPELGCQ